MNHAPPKSHQHVIGSIGSVVLFSNIIIRLNSPREPLELHKLKIGYRRFEFGWILLKSP
jgi:hypothetical protein